MDELLLKNDSLQVSVSPLGAEVTRMTASSGKELLWEGTPSLWGHVSPLLFPFPGTLEKGYYLCGGKKYPMSQGGFVKDSLFTVLDQNDHQAILRLSMPEEEYPFALDLLVAYTLKNKQLAMEYNLVNKGFTPAYYGLGRQFAIACPEGTEYQRLVFDAPESPVVHQMMGPYLSDETADVGRGITQLALGGSHFGSGCLFLSSLKGMAVTLVSVKTGRRVRVDFSGFEYLRIWRRQRAQFISIEPWTTLPDMDGAESLLSRKSGIEILPPGKTRQYKHLVTWIEE